MRRIDRSGLERRRLQRRRRLLIRWLVLFCVIVVIALGVLIGVRSCGNSGSTGTSGSTTTTKNATGTTGKSGTTTTGKKSGSTDTSGSTTTSQGSSVNMTVAAAADTAPSVMGFKTSIFHGTSSVPSFLRSQSINFGPGKDYTTLPGIITFRGNNYRDSPSYGTADITAGQLSVLWSIPTGSIAKGEGTGAWTGSGWTGQPLIVQWPDDLKSIMNLKPEKQSEAGLTEIIYPCLDGNIYFLDLKDGSYTRPVIRSGGGPFKGTGSIYPNGTPLLFVGHGDNAPGKQVVRSRLYSLIDQSLLYTFGTKPDANALRKWTAYDSSALFDVGTDTIIEPGENGLLYTIKLNTQFDKTAGTLKISPGMPVKYRYTTPNYKDGSANTPKTRWLGMEDSAVAYRNYLFIADNGGSLMCIDLNTMKLVWAQSCQDDTNTSPIFEESPEDGTCYLYISTSLHLSATGAKDPRKGGIPVWKINAANGEVVWKTKDYPCYTISDVSGGVQATPILGKNDISNLVIYPIARTPTTNAGILVALDKKTGAEVWKTPFDNYSWSSPVAIYTPQGKSYIVECDSVGHMYLLDGTTGKVLSTLDLGANIEASPSVFGNTIVVGTRGQKIFAVKVS